MRPSIYIGLGGTGIRILAAIKKQYEDVYGKGNLPPIVNFLAIDYNLADIKNPELSTSLEEDALLIPYVGDPRKHLEARIEQGDYKWMFPGNTCSIFGRLASSPDQLRTTGRFYTEYLIHIIESAICNRWNQVTNIANADENGAPIPCLEIDIYILTSLCGGTGAGSFINIAELTRRLYGERCNIIGYGVLHSIFQTMDPLGTHSPKGRVNAYSAIKDLDYLMSATPSKPVKFTINGQERVLSSPPFDLFYVVDNKTDNGQTVTNIQELCTYVGLHIYTRSQIPLPEVPGPQWKHTLFDIADKRGWASGMGVMRVVYKGDLLAKIYGCKAAIELIDKMRQEGSFIAQRAIDWMMAARILENEYNDLHINFIYSAEALGKLKGPKVAIQDSLLYIHTTVQNYVNTLADFPEAKVLAELQAEKDYLLKAELESILSNDGNVANALIFLQTLRDQLYSCREKMEAEAATMKEQLADISSVLAKAQQEYENYGGKFFRTNRGKQERLDLVSATAKRMLKFTLEVKRREAARDIFTHLLEVIDKYSYQIQSANAFLANLSYDYEQELITLINQSGTPFFEYDLSLDKRTKIAVDSEDIGFAGFISKLPKSLLELDVDTELKPAINAYVEGMPQAVAYRTKSIAEVIEEMDNEEAAKLQQAFIQSSTQMLRINNRGISNRDRWHPSDILVNHSHTCLAYDHRYRTDHDALIQKRLQSRYIISHHDCSGIGPQEMVMFHTWEAVIPYCIEAFDERVVEEYERVIEAYLSGGSTFNPHFDKELFDQMRQEGFSLKPRSASEEPEQ